MFRYTRAAVDIVVEDIKRYCNIFKNGSIIFTLLYFIYVFCTGSGNLTINIILTALFVVYTFLDLITKNKELKSLKRFIKKSYTWLKFITKTFTLGIIVYGVYTATTHITPFSIILVTLMIILWALQLLFEIVISIFEDKRDLLVAGWSKDIENLKKPATTVTNFIKRVKGEEIIIEDDSNSREIKILERRVAKNKEKTTSK